MLIDPSQVLKNFDGSDLKDPKDGEKPIQLRHVLVNAFSFEDQELKSTAEQKMRAYILCTMLMGDKELDLKAEDTVFVKARLLKMYSPLIYGQVCEIIDPTTK